MIGWNEIAGEKLLYFGTNVECSKLLYSGTREYVIKKCNDDILVKHKNILPLSKKKRQPRSE